MYSADIPAPVWALLGITAGAILKGLFDLLLARQTSTADQRKTSGSVESSDAKIVFDAGMGVVAGQQAALVMSEQMRHDLRDQVERCQLETAKVKEENDALDDRLRTQAEENAKTIAGYRKKLDNMAAELEKLHKQLEEKT